nr:mucin-2-like isoform X3 [Syngnathus scovelli]
MPPSFAARLLMTLTLCQTCTELFGCPTGWPEYNKHCYFFGNDRKTWWDARLECASKGAHLDWLQSLKKSATAWIGLRCETTDRPWQWADATSFYYLAWDGGETNNWHGNEENCVEMLPRGHWNVFPCASANLMPYICKRPVSPTTTTAKPVTCPTPAPCPTTTTAKPATCPTPAPCPTTTTPAKPATCPTPAPCPTTPAKPATCPTSAPCPTTTPAKPVTCPTPAPAPTTAKPATCPTPAPCPTTAKPATCPIPAPCPTTTPAKPVTCPTPAPTTVKPATSPALLLLPAPRRRPSLPPVLPALLRPMGSSRCAQSPPKTRRVPPTT